MARDILAELNNDNDTYDSVNELVQRKLDSPPQPLETFSKSDINEYKKVEKSLSGRALADAELKDSKGKILANGTPQNKFRRPAIDPERLKVEDDGTIRNPYLNWPIKEIDDVPVVLIGAVPFYNKECTWDENYRHLSEHFTQCEHPNYHNAVYCKIRYADLFKQVSDAWVVRTDQEIQLWRAREVG